MRGGRMLSRMHISVFHFSDYSYYIFNAMLLYSHNTVHIYIVTLNSVIEMVDLLVFFPKPLIP